MASLSMVSEAVFKRELDPARYFRILVLNRLLADRHIVDYLSKSGVVQPKRLSSRQSAINELDILKILLVEDLISDGISRANCLLFADNQNPRVQSLVKQFISDPNPDLNIKLRKIQLTIPDAKIRYQNVLLELRGLDVGDRVLGECNINYATRALW